MHNAIRVSQINTVNIIEFRLFPKFGANRFELIRVEREPGVKRIIGKAKLTYAIFLYLAAILKQNDVSLCQYS